MAETANKTAKHTPGDWTIDGYAVIGDGGEIVCVLGTIDGFESGYTATKNCDADGALIIASKGLLSSCSELLDLIHDSMSHESIEHHADAIARARAAINKAVPNG